MERLASRLNTDVVYFTEKPFDYSGYEDCRYFICWQGTNNVLRAYRTQADCIEGLEELIEEKEVCIGSRIFTVIKD